MTARIDLGVNQIADRVHTRLRRYLEAQYHIRNSALIEERRLLLEQPGGISQRPFIEVTPSYAVSSDFTGLKAPAIVTDLLQELMKWKPGIGVFPPYKHQADAIEAFFARGHDGDDLIVATGTGSGKTETFLYSILGMLAIEGTERTKSYRLPGMRALLLYPMNALVSDQTSRLRRLLGDERFAELARTRWGRHPRFGMYTSRTPYPGTRSSDKDKRHLETLLSYYEALETSNEDGDRALVRELKARGRWPAKDVVRFFGRDMEEKGLYKTGSKGGQEYTKHNWKRRFLTQSGDRELLTRHEMQLVCPDLLITNYSMLEYMLLRPIERPVFAQTRRWLSEDPRNQLLLILDEAHMYRGVGGAEVGLLIRRLMSRLGITRDKLRCILTSASLGTGPEATIAAQQFGLALTGCTELRNFSIVRGTREARSGQRPGTIAEATALATVNPTILAAARIARADADLVLQSVSQALGWECPIGVSENELAARQRICKSLTGFGPLEVLLNACSGNAVEFTALARSLFPGASHEIAERALDGLLALGTFARRCEPGREEQPLLPTRVHLLFRGLPSLHACINPKCTARRHTSSTPLIGRLYTEPRTHCTCGGRVFELLTHRDCGAAYLRVYGTSQAADFFWHERGGILTKFGSPLHEYHVLLEEPHPKQGESVRPILLDVMTGRVLPVSDGEVPDAILCYIANRPADGIPNVTTFSACPVCTRRTHTGGALKIMDLATKGEQPFANLVREQFVVQSPTKESSERHPNEGRKEILFSDGRQKAARLARDLPREVERDSFREALVLACAALHSLPSRGESVLDERLYGAFVSVCAKFHLHFFDGPDQRVLLEECARFRCDYGSDLEMALDMEWKPIPPTRYRTALLRQIGDPYYSLVAACAATVTARRNKNLLLRQRMGNAFSQDALEDLTNAWIREMLGRNAFDSALGLDARQDEFPYFQPIRSVDGLKYFFDDLQIKSGAVASNIDRLRDSLFDVFTREASDRSDSGRLLTNDSVILTLALDAKWLQCAVCGHLQAKALCGKCENCGDSRLEPRTHDHSYMVARKGFFIEPLRSVLNGERPVHITAEEHTAQLSQRDAGVVYATTEEFELRFQDVPLGNDKPPVDILSCTTTMEVGIDIGSLTAVGLRTVPPQRENYQQRAGRAGRRGTSVSSVLMFAQGGAHDAHYFANPQSIISGPPREPRINSDNPRLARRHIHSHLLQLFFHGQIDALPSAEQERLAAERPGIMSAFGSVSEFFSGNGPFSYTAFKAWMNVVVLSSNGNVVQDIAAWLPTNIIQNDGSPSARREFVRKVAEKFGEEMDALAVELAKAERDADDSDDERLHDGLLDILFGQSLLPSYAFPTDLCSFVIQEWAEQPGQVRVAERPQLAKAQALSEYAPGRLLVVNKRTYRVGGIFVEGRVTSSPAASLFEKPLRRYVGCPTCPFIRIEEKAGECLTAEGSPCPVCTTPLYVREFLDPPGFSPERGRPLGEGDREQDITYASSAQMPEIVNHDEFAWRNGPGQNLYHAYGEDVLLVIVNKGDDVKGFSVCERCGAAWLDGEEPANAHARPFLLPDRLREKEGAAKFCSGAIRRNLFLFHEFRTDLLLLQTAFQSPLDFSPEQPWIHDALATLAEALSLGASLHLDIDPGELSAGYRLLPPRNTGELGIAELYLFDTSSGGAGYSADAGVELDGVLDQVENILLECPGNCERSCTKCLRHYGNRFLHGRLDRRLAHCLLAYMRRGTIPTIGTVGSQAEVLAPLKRFLELEGWKVASESAVDRPLVAESPTHKCVAIGVCPAFLALDSALVSHPMQTRNGESRIILPDYLVQRDLPSAYQIVCGNRRMQTSARRTPAQWSDLESGPVVKLPVKELRRLSIESPLGMVQLCTSQPVPDNAYAARVPSAVLNAIGFASGSWLILRATTPKDLAGDSWIVVARSSGKFGATNEGWTIAHVKPLDETGGRVQLSYGGAKAREYRPERVNCADINVVAVVVCQATEVS